MISNMILYALLIALAKCAAIRTVTATQTETVTVQNGWRTATVTSTATATYTVTSTAATTVTLQQQSVPDYYVHQNIQQVQNGQSVYQIEGTCNKATMACIKGAPSNIQFNIQQCKNEFENWAKLDNYYERDILIAYLSTQGVGLTGDNQLQFNGAKTLLMPDTAYCAVDVVYNGDGESNGLISLSAVVSYFDQLINWCQDGQGHAIGGIYGACGDPSFKVRLRPNNYGWYLGSHFPGIALAVGTSDQ